MNYISHSGSAWNREPYPRELLDFGLTRRISLPMLRTGTGVLLVFSQGAFPQATAPDGAAQTGVVLTKLYPPIFPLWANVARIDGDVQIDLGIRQDGSVESATVVTGHRLLAQAALESAKQSQFRCNACKGSTTSYSLIYSFMSGRILQHACTAGTPDWNLWRESREQITQSDNHVTVIARLQVMCPDPDSCGTHKGIRSPRCLYLWKCRVVRMVCM